MIDASIGIARGTLQSNGHADEGYLAVIGNEIILILEDSTDKPFYGEIASLRRVCGEFGAPDDGFASFIVFSLRGQ